MHKLFLFYCNNDPVKTRNQSGRAQSSSGSENLSLEGVLKFMYNYDIIDRFVKRKSLATILDSFGSRVGFSQFMKLLRLIAEEMYFENSTINSTSKLKLLLSKLALGSPLSVRQTDSRLIMA